MRYDETAAKRYRDHDEALHDSRPYGELVAWLQSVCAKLPRGFDALDLGCGTGRYFWAIDGARTLTGLDASAPMLEHAKRPLHGERVTAERVTLVEGSLLTHDFAPASFDLVYWVGVLAEHVPLDEQVVARVSRWLRPRGLFAFTTVDPNSPSVPKTAVRRAARTAAQVAPRPLSTALRKRLLSGGLYADQHRVRELLADNFAIETLEPFESEAHLHCRCVARRIARP